MSLVSGCCSRPHLDAGRRQRVDQVSAADSRDGCGARGGAVGSRREALPRAGRAPSRLGPRQPTGSRSRWPTHVGPARSYLAGRARKCPEGGEDGHSAGPRGDRASRERAGAPSSGLPPGSLTRLWRTLDNNHRKVIEQGDRRGRRAGKSPLARWEAIWFAGVEVVGKSGSAPGHPRRTSSPKSPHSQFPGGLDGSRTLRRRQAKLGETAAASTSARRTATATSFREEASSGAVAWRGFSADAVALSG